MLKPEPMSRVLIVGAEEAKEKAIETLYAADLLHIEDFQEVDPYFSMGKPLPEGADQSEKLTKLRSISNYINIKDAEQSPRPVSQVEKELDKKLSVLDEKLSSQLEHRSEVDTKIKEIESGITSLKPFISLNIPLELLSGYRSLSVFIGTCNKKKAETASKALSEFDTVDATTEEKDFVVAVFVPTDDRDKAATEISDAGLQLIAIPEGNGDPSSLTNKLTSELGELQERRKQIELEITALRDEYAEYLRASIEHMTTKVERSEVPLHFAQGKHVWACDGWLPSKKVETVTNDLEETTGGSVHLEVLEVEQEGIEDADIPVEYNNPKIVKPLEGFTDIFTRPLYSEIDPTIVLFILVPIFYGFMLGDVAYGIFILVIAFVLCRYLTTVGWRSLLNTLKMAAIMSIIFGFIYGEFLGFEMFGHASIFGLHDMEPLLFRFGTEGHAAEMAKAWIPMLLVITVLIGVAHMTLGYVFGFRNEYRSHGLKKAVMHKLSWILVLLGGTIAVAAIMPALMGPQIVNFVDPMFLTGAGMGVFGILLIVKGEGFIGILEVPALLSNTLSYTRLLAVGLSSVGIAFAINLISLELLPELLGGLLGGILGMVVIVIGHAANTALGILSPGLHAIRLHYVEFFTKFFIGGGHKYEPFGYERKYTEE